jgi:protoporphyrinogen oxidase
MKQMDAFEVIVVGAGLAGLAAADELGRRRVLVLEAGARAGGKVETIRRDGGVHERGALFAFNPAWVPFPVAADDLEREDLPIGLSLDGRLIRGDTVAACLGAVGADIPESLSVGYYLGSPSPQSPLIGSALSRALNAFFRVIHPGDLAEYVPARRRDALLRHDASHFRHGNGALVEAFLDRLGAEVRTECRVTRLSVEPGGVTVGWRGAYGDEQARADRVVLATPAREALDLLGERDGPATTFLRRVRYGPGIAVILGLDDTELEPFSYVVSADGTVNTFVFHHDARTPGLTVLTAYIVAEQAAAIWERGDDELAALVREELNALGLGAVAAAEVLWSDVRRWPEVGPIVSQAAYGDFSPACLHPAPRLVLAGDYTWWDGAQMPYGMQAAILSGRRAAALVGEGAGALPTPGSRLAPLAVSLVTRLTDAGPVVKGSVPDGTIAYYGLLLSAEPDPEIERYLLGEAEDGLWAYQQGYGVTALDSALVMEGLLASGRHAALLEASAARLVEKFFDAGEGGFRTLPHGRTGRAPYWQGTDCPATAFCAWLLARIAPTRYAAECAAAAAFLRRRQSLTGEWPGKWFPSRTIPAFYAVRLLATSGAESAAACRRAGLWLRSRQEEDGSWTGAVIETSAALLALAVLGGHDEVVARGREWLARRRTAVGWPGEPILHYWFEEAGGRTYYHTADTGRITSAWATLALREAPRPA